MSRIAILGILLFLSASASAKTPAAAEPEKTHAREKHKTAEEIQELRDTAKPLVELRKRQGTEMSVLKRAQVAEKKQLRQRLSGAEPAVRAKAMSDLIKKHRAAFNKARAANKAESDKFVKNNPGTERAYKELLYSGLRVEESSAALVGIGTPKQ